MELKVNTSVSISTICITKIYITSVYEVFILYGEGLGEDYLYAAGTTLSDHLDSRIVSSFLRV
jgi:hypothetical protein